MDEQEAAALAVRASAAVVAGGVGLANPVAGLVAAGLVPAVEAAVTRWQARQARNVEEALDVAAKAAGLPGAALIDRLSSDTTRLVFLSEALTAAARSTYSERVRALGRALASGALAEDEAKVDEERLWVGILAEVEAPHLRMLLQLVIPRDQQPLGMTPQSPQLAQAAGVSNVAAGLLLATLERQGLASPRWGDSFPKSYAESRGGSASERFWVKTPLANQLLEKFREAGSSGP